jgi:hypothetical protein
LAGRSVGVSLDFAADDARPKTWGSGDEVGTFVADVFSEGGSEALAANMTLGIDVSDSQTTDNEFLAGRSVGVS